MDYKKFFMLDYSKIKVICLDVDGTLTDGIYHVGTSICYRPIILKSFYTRDFAAISKAIEAGYEILILTGATDNVIDSKLDSLDWQVRKHIKVIKSPRNKHMALVKYAAKNGIVLTECVAYIGDSENDLESMKICHLTACPSDAMPIIKEEANYICDNPGGRGAVCEFIDLILENK